MEQTKKPTTEKWAYGPALLISYLIAKKVLKYSFYIIVLYFAFEGFMAWD